MSTSFADHFGIPQELFDSTGALDPILDVDTRLFIDPSLLRVAETPELAGAYAKFTNHFEDLLRLISSIQQPDDLFWRNADRRLRFPEVSGLSIGYATTGTRGSGIGPGLRRQILVTAHQLVQAGINDPAIFELAGIFEDDIGPDRISDMVATIICEELIAFTQRVCAQCAVPMTPQDVGVRNIRAALPINPVTGRPIILVPQEVLRDLPTADNFGDVRWIAQHNEVLRGELNQLIGASWRRVTAGEQKAKLREDFVRFPDVLRQVIEAYKAAEPEPYDFANDPAGEVVWYRATQELPRVAPLSLSLPEAPTAQDVFHVVLQICEHFRALIEDGQLARLLYDQDGKPKHESAAQLVFYGVASAYCKANNLDLSPEADAGRGPVDFKVSRGFEGKVLVELKLTSNKNLTKGFVSQLPIYQRAEGALLGVYLVIDNGKATKTRADSFKEIVRNAEQPAPYMFWVDGTVRPSASHSDGAY